MSNSIIPTTSSFNEKHKDVLISIIVPMYNAEKFVNDLIPCLIGQTLQEIEIILVNDGSKDGTLPLLREYEKQDSRIKVIDTPNEGVSEARNKGLDAAIGEYIWLIDVDDFVFPECAEIMYREVSGRDMIISDYVRATDRRKALQTERRTKVTKRNVANNIEEMAQKQPFAD